MMGSARILQLVFIEEKVAYPHFGLFTLEERGKFTTKPLDQERRLGFDDSDSEKESLVPAEDALNSQEEIRCKDYAPNISLNVRSFTDSDRQELRIAAAFGVLIQTIVLLFSGFATYHPKMAYKKEGEQVEQYAFPLAAAGTIMVAIGMFICSSIVESSTVEKEWRFLSDWERRQWANDNFGEEADGPGPRNTKLRVIWLQQEGGVNDQSFDSYVLFGKGAQDAILTSELAVTSALENGPTEPINHSTGCSTSAPSDSAASSKPSRFRRTWVLLGTFTSLSGFILQFTGLRGLHWSATISQLVGTMIMLVVRAFIRRHLILAPSVYEAHRNHELDWLATRIAKDPTMLWEGCSEQNDGHYNDEIGPTDEKDASEGCHCDLVTPDCYKWQIISGVDLETLNFTYPTTTRQSEDKFTKRKEYKIPEPEESLPYLHRVVKIRERIGHLSNWETPLSETAVTLASAIEVVMNTLFSKSPYTQMYWRLHGPAVGEDSTEREKVLEPIYLCVSRGTKASSWTASAAELESILSLWLYSVHAQELGDQRLTSNPSTPGIADEPERGSRVRFGQGNTQNRMCVRRLGPAGGKMVQLLRKWYLGGRTANIRRILRETSGQSWQFSGDANWRCKCNAQSLNPTTETAEKHRIVGFNQKLGTKDDIQHLLRRTAPTTFHTVPYDAHDGSILCSSCGFLDPENRELGVFSMGALELLFAQDLFASFMWTVANHHDGTIGGATTIHPLEPGISRSDGWDNFTLRNTVLSNLANDLSRISNVSLALGNPDDIYISVITPFCYHRKLPIPTEIVDHAHRAAEEREGKGSWAEAGNVYRSLFSACESFGSNHPTYLTAASLLYEHSQALLNRKLLQELEDSDSFWQMRMEGQRESSDFKQLESEERNCLVSFSSRSATVLLRRIEGSYALQGRSLKELMSNPTLRTELQEQRIERIVNAAEENLEWLHRPTLKLARDLAVGIEKDRILEKFNETLSSHRYLDKPRYEINKPDLTGWTALHYVAAFGSGTHIRKLSQAEGQQTDETGEAMLRNDSADDRDLLDLFTRYIRRKTIKDIDAEDFSGRSPLHYAHSKATASMLIQCGANLHHRSSYGLTPLHSAAQLGNLETVAFFLKSSNSIVGALDQFRRTPLHWAVLGGHLNIIKLLIENGADINACDSKGRNLFHYAVLKGCPRVSISEIYQSCEEISNRDMLLNAKESNGLTPLHLAAKLGSLDSLSAASPLALSVLRPGEPSSGPSGGPYGLRAIHYAALYGHHKDVQLILASEEYGPEEIDSRDGRGATPLLMAAEAGHASVVRTLLDEGADFKTRDDINKRTALSIAARKGESEIFRIILTKYGRKIDDSTDDRSALFGATKEVMQEVVSALLDGHEIERKIDIGAIDGASPLLWASKNRKREIAKLLLDLHWVDPDEINVADDMGRTPLSHAAANGEAEIVRLLLSREEVCEQVNKEDNTGLTALHWAAQNGETDVVEVLLATPNTNINAKNKDGRTPLSLAVENERSKTIRVFLRRDDIDVSAVDNDGHSAIWWAKRADFPDLSIIDFLQMRLDRNKAQAELGEKDEENGGEDTNGDVAKANEQIGDLIEVEMKDSE